MPSYAETIIEGLPCPQGWNWARGEQGFIEGWSSSGAPMAVVLLRPADPGNPWTRWEAMAGDGANDGPMVRAATPLSAVAGALSRAHDWLEGDHFLTLGRQMEQLQEVAHAC